MNKLLLLLLFSVGSLFAHGNILTLSFTGMSPHSGQKLQARVVDKYNNHEVARQTIAAISSPDFMLFFDGIEPGKDYNIDFYADLNSNGLYDNPPADHTWRIELNDVLGDTIIPFAHNTSFTPLDWQYAVTFNLESMTPHLGQQLEVRLIDKKTRKEITRDSLTAIQSASFSFVLPGIIPDESYWIDFYADHNGNGLYDAPPADHAWRSELEKPQGDTVLSFIHNTTFTDIKWKYPLFLQFTGMTPHLGQLLEARVTDRSTQLEVGRTSISSIPQADFEIYIPGIEASGYYRVDFYADHNGNGLYNAPPTDHAWRIDTEAADGVAMASFSHNTNFTPINWDYLVELELKNMTPHLNQKIEARVVNASTGKEVGRQKLDVLYDDEVSIFIPGIQTNTNYNVDFYADLNGNGHYDAPPADHAWRESYNPGDDGYNDISFTHNTTFTDIDWEYLATLNLINMTPHLGQLFQARLVNSYDGSEQSSVTVDAVPAANFSVPLPGINISGVYIDYDIDFYADHNGNKVYDAPPADHAWRESFTATTGDQEINFTHNTNFTNINFPTALGDKFTVAGEFKLYNNYPNPFNPSTTIRFSIPQSAFVELAIYNIAGQKIKTLVQQQLTQGSHQFLWNGDNEAGIAVGSGIYFYSLKAEKSSDVKRMILVK